jgi:hypothetical protein
LILAFTASNPVTNRLSYGAMSGRAFGVRFFWYRETTQDMSEESAKKGKLLQETGGEGKRQQTVNDEQTNYRKKERKKERKTNKLFQE